MPLPNFPRKGLGKAEDSPVETLLAMEAFVFFHNIDFLP
jgi:hypothetical protein